jgi:hypothetical protein
MALFPECMESCAQKVVDTAGIVRDAIFRQLSESSPGVGTPQSGGERLSAC